jgi:hypothetical protein
VARNLVVIVVGANQVTNPPPLCFKEKEALESLVLNRSFFDIFSYKEIPKGLNLQVKIWPILFQECNEGFSINLIKCMDKKVGFLLYVIISNQPEEAWSVDLVWNIVLIYIVMKIGF